MPEDREYRDVYIRVLAVRQLEDYDAHQPGTLFADGVTLGVCDACRLQAATAELRVARGDRIIGYKVGCTSTTIRQQLGIDHSITGRLYDSESHSSSTKLSRHQFDHLAIEGELAVELSRPPVPEDFQNDRLNSVKLPECVSRIFPVIELHNYVVRGKVPTAGELIANNAIHAGFIRGDGILQEQFVVQEGSCSLQILVDDEIIADCKGAQLIQAIRSSLEWLLIHTKQNGEQLKAGQIVLTGSIPQLIPVQKNCRIKVETQPFGSVEVGFID